MDTNTFINELKIVTKYDDVDCQSLEDYLSYLDTLHKKVSDLFEKEINNESTLSKSDEFIKLIDFEYFMLKIGVIATLSTLLDENESEFYYVDCEIKLKAWASIFGKTIDKFRGKDLYSFYELFLPSVKESLDVLYETQDLSRAITILKRKNNVEKERDELSIKYRQQKEDNRDLLEKYYQMERELEKKKMAVPEYGFKKAGEGWVIYFKSREIIVKDRKGIKEILSVLNYPNNKITYSNIFKYEGEVVQPESEMKGDNFEELKRSIREFSNELYNLDPSEPEYIIISEKIENDKDKMFRAAKCGTNQTEEMLSLYNVLNHAINHIMKADSKLGSYIRGHFDNSKNSAFVFYRGEKFIEITKN